ncbi:MAG TPA: hypothetical protein DCM86_08830 [Verrucomicrobiales bacterium]|nr:hypothetical protein [Verrucomicrobiales bacterium]
MEYFTRKAYETAQTPKGRKQWQQVEKQYATHLRSINPHLKDAWRQLATDDFSGEAVRVVERPAFDQVILELKDHMLIFRGVRQARLPEVTGSGVTWVCHEVHVAGSGLLEVKALLSEGEFRVTAEEVRIYRADASSSRAAA